MFHPRKKKNRLIAAAAEARDTQASTYDPDSYLTVTGFGLPAWAFTFEEEVRKQCQSYLRQVHPDEYNGDYLDAFLTAKASLLRRNLDLQLEEKTFVLQERARGHEAKALRAQEALAQGERELDRLRQELDELRQLHTGPLL